MNKQMQTNKRDADETRERILQVAAQEFATKGFAGARVDAIAEKANVNKALIYYYFQSKKNLLDILFERLIDKGIDLSVYLETIEKPADGDFEAGYVLFDKILQYLGNQEDIIRILIMESLKAGGEDVLGKLLSLYFDSRITKVVEEMKEKGVKVPEDKSQWVITELFTALLPTIMYMLFRKDLSQKLGKDVDELNKMFIQAIGATHMKTHIPE